MTGTTRRQRLTAGPRTALLAAVTGTAAVLLATTQLAADAAVDGGVPVGSTAVGADVLPGGLRVAASVAHAEVHIASVSAPVLAAASSGAPAASASSASSDTTDATAGTGQPSDGQDLGTFLVTCYDLRGTTADGDQAGPESVAVDPSVIPLGTRIDIQGVGWRTADDTGGAVQGHHIDIWEPSEGQCAAFGRQYLDVHRAA